MLKIHTNDGLTACVDLEDEEQAREWIERLKDPRLQSKITGVTVAHRGVQYSLPRPLGFDHVVFQPEIILPDDQKKIKGGERVVCQAGDVRVELMVHKAQRAARVSLKRTGKQRFNPWAK